MSRFFKDATNQKKKVLVVGSGGREHALAWKCAQSRQVQQVFVAPGNGGTANEPYVSNVPIAVTDIEQLTDFAQNEMIDMTIVGPEAPLVLGIADCFKQEGLRCLGPSKTAAQIESSKLFAKKFMERHAIATAAYASFDCADEARAYIDEQSRPLVIKADGLATGKGVLTAHTKEQACDAVDQLLVHKRFGDAGQTIVIEEYITGIEASIFVLTDGNCFIPFGTAQDYKTLHKNGPMTGGMGAISPAPIVTDVLHERILHEIIEPTITGLRQEGTPFVGFLYAGLMITPEGDPKVLEFNCRLGDPETQPLLMCLNEDLFSVCEAVFEQRLSRMILKWSNQMAVGLVLASGGYPGAYEKGYHITGFPIDMPSIKVFHAGTVQTEKGLMTNGGRVLCVAALGDTVQDAREKVYEAAGTISWPDRYYRADIGL